MALQDFLASIRKAKDLTTADLAIGNRYCWTENATNWNKVSVAHPSVLVPVGTVGTTYYTFGSGPPQGVIDRSEYEPARNGICFFHTPGDWWVNVQLAGSAAAQVCFVVHDCGTREAAQVLFQLLSSSTTGTDILRWGGALLDAGRNADADADFAAALVGALANVRLAAWNPNNADYSRLSCAKPSTLHGESWDSAQLIYLRSLAAAVGRDSGDQTMRLIESRASANSQSTALYRLLVDSQTRVYDLIQGAYQLTGGVEGVSGGGYSFLGAVDGRESAYFASRAGRKFRVTDEGASITASNGFTATAPRMTIEAGATNELIVRKIKIGCLAAGTTNLRYRIILDPDARYSSGGTAGTVGARVNMNGGNATAAGFTYHYGGITATATDADEREVETGVIVNVTGNSVEITFEDGLIIPASGTLLIYVYDAGATGTAHLMAELEEVNIQ